MLCRDGVTRALVDYHVYMDIHIKTTSHSPAEENRPSAMVICLCLCVSLHICVSQVVDREVPVEMLQVLPDNGNTEVCVCARMCLVRVLLINSKPSHPFSRLFKYWKMQCAFACADWSLRILTHRESRLSSVTCR